MVQSRVFSGLPLLLSPLPDISFLQTSMETGL